MQSDLTSRGAAHGHFFGAEVVVFVRGHAGLNAAGLMHGGDAMGRDCLPVAMPACESPSACQLVSTSKWPGADVGNGLGTPSMQALMAL